METHPFKEKIELAVAARSETSQGHKKFEEREVLSSSGFSYDIFSRDAQLAPTTQLSCSNERVLI